MNSNNNNNSNNHSVQQIIQGKRVTQLNTSFLAELLSVKSYFVK